jgi:PAS domain S-box-containing protein
MLIPILSLVLLTLLAVMLWRVRGEVRAGRAAAFMLLAQAAWVVGWIGETLAGDVSSKLRWDGATWIFTLLAMAAAFQVAESQAARSRPDRIRSIALLAITAPSALWSLYVSFRGARPDAHLEHHGEFSSLIYTFTWIETGIALFLLLVVASSAGYVLIGAMRRPPGRRTEAVMLALGLIGPYFVMDVAFVVGARWMGQRDVAPLAFALFAPITTLALLRGRTVELMLVARDQVVEELSDAVLVVDAQGRLVDVNAQARALLGTSGASVGRRLDDFPDVEPLLQAIEQGPGATRQVTSGSRQFDVHVSSLRGTEGGDAKVLVLHDVTALRDANAALSAARDELEHRVRERTAEVFDRERLLSAVFDNSLQYMGLLDREGRVLTSNQAANALVGCTAEEVAGQPFWETPWWRHDPAQAEQIRLGVQAAARGEPFRMLVTHPDLDGTLREVDFSLSPVRDAEGQVRWLTAEGRDLTRMRRGEREREELQQQVMHLQRLESIGRLAGGVAHDFNNYLTAIMGNAALVREGVVEGSPDAEALDGVLHAARSASQVTRQLLAIGRRQPAGTGPVDIAASLNRLHGLLGRLLGAEIELVTRGAPNTGLAAIDPGPLEQVLVNLAINARDAMPDGGVLSIAADSVVLDEHEARARAIAPGEYVRITVSDTGHGITAEMRERIFEPFFTTKPEGKGTGLGLAIVYSVLRGAGGHVEVQPTDGPGAHFVLHLPSATRSGVAATASLPAPRAHGSGRVLVVDDRDEVRRFVERGLRDRGFELRTAGSAREALDVLDGGWRPDLLLCDVRMPGTSGPALVQMLRERGDRVPVLYMSGQHDGAVGLSADDTVIAKPFTIDALVTAIGAAALPTG